MFVWNQGFPSAWNCRSGEAGNPPANAGRRDGFATLPSVEASSSRVGVSLMVFMLDRMRDQTPFVKMRFYVAGTLNMPTPRRRVYRVDGFLRGAYFHCMSTVAEIKAAIDQLSLPERCELEALLQPFGDDAWDEQMKRDAAAGKFDVLNDGAGVEHSAGKTVPLAQLLRES